MSELKSKGNLCVWGDSHNSVVGIATGDEFSNFYLRSREELDAHIARLRAAGIVAWGRKVVQGRSNVAYRLEGDILVDEEGNQVSLSRKDGRDCDVEYGGNWNGVQIETPPPANEYTKREPFRYPLVISDDGKMIPGGSTVISQARRVDGHIIGPYGPGSIDTRPDGNWSCPEK